MLLKLITLLIAVFTYLYLSVWIYRYVNSYCGVLLIVGGILWIFHRVLKIQFKN